MFLVGVTVAILLWRVVVVVPPRWWFFNGIGFIFAFTVFFSHQLDEEKQQEESRIFNGDSLKLTSRKRFAIKRIQQSTKRKEQSRDDKRLIQDSVLRTSPANPPKPAPNPTVIALVSSSILILKEEDVEFYLRIPVKS